MLNFSCFCFRSEPSSPASENVEANLLESTKDTVSTEKNKTENNRTENTIVEPTIQKEDNQDMKTSENENKQEFSTKMEISETKNLESRKNEIEKERIPTEQGEKGSEDSSCRMEETSLESHKESNKEKTIEFKKVTDSPKDLKQVPTKDKSPLRNDNKESTTDKEGLEMESTGTSIVVEGDAVSDKGLSENIEKKDGIVQEKENIDSKEQEIDVKQPEVTQESHQQDSEIRREKSIEKQPEKNSITNVVLTEQPKETVENKPTAKKTTKVSPKTQKKMKGNQNGTGEKKRATRSRSAISPRGYGYSMAVMHPEVSKPDPTPVETKPTPPKDQATESIDTIIDSLGEDTAVIELEPDALESNETSTSQNQTKVKTKNFQAKKFRLDQITVKLSAQRQSEAEAAVQSPSAFQMATVQQSSSPPMMATPPPAALCTPPPQKIPSPPASLASHHYPMDTFNVPPPLIYAPMAAQCCSNPHCQQHGNVYPPPPRAQLHGGMSHPMHLPPSHLHPRSAGYVMYPPGHGPTYDTRPPMSCEYNTIGIPSHTTP